MTVGPQPTQRRSTAAIAEQWDAVAQERDAQIRSGRDISYRHVLTPAVLGLAEDADWKRVLDVGCGTGVLSEILSDHAGSLVGVDPSKRSVAIAEASAKRPANVRYVNASIESFADSFKGPSFSLAVANMVLQDTPDLEDTLNAIASVLRRRAIFVCTITHPCFWPVYWGYDTAKWYDYTSELAIEAPFKISSVPNPVGITTHYHRPLSRYVAALVNAGFVIEFLLEPMPRNADQHLYPQPWRHPRFLALRCRRTARLAIVR